jgi:site-specific DNA-methyltransferase (adenine-specific)
MSPVRAHSQKPDEQYGLIERLMGDLPRIELFARQRWPGWDSWGDEVPEEVVSAR